MICEVLSREGFQEELRQYLLGMSSLQFLIVTGSRMEKRANLQVQFGSC